LGAYYSNCMSGPITPDGRRVDPTPHLAAVASAMARPGQPAATYAALEAAMEAVLGHRLFTILRYHADSGESERVWTNRPAAYPVAGRKALNPTFWSRQVLQERRPYLGRTAADLREVFFEYLERRFRGDPGVSVLVDRRRHARPAGPASSRAVVLFHGVTVVRPGELCPRPAPSRPDDRRQTMTEAPADLEDRQRVDRWLEESQYLLGRLIPGYLEDRERLKARLAGSEADCQRLRLEVDGLRREVSGLLAELQHQRNE